MRIAIAQDTPGYETFAKLRDVLDGNVWRIRIFIDREERKDVLMADEEAGEIWVWDRNPDGSVKTRESASGGPEAVRRSLKGFVQVLVDGPRPRGEG